MYIAEYRDSNLRFPGNTENGSEMMSMAGKQGLDLTEGSIGKKLILFSLPLLAGNLIQQLYNTVDAIFVGNFIGKSASAAIGTSHFMISFLVCFFAGMAVGSGVIASQMFGAKNSEGLDQAVHSSVALSLAGGFVLMAVGYAVVPLYVRVIGTPVSLRPDALSYLRIYFLALPWVSLYNQCSGVIRALGDGKTPMMAQLVGGIINIGANYLFIRVFRNGINGVAWATLISQCIASFIVIRRLTQLDGRYALRLKKISFHLPTLKRIVAIGLPAGGQYLVISLANAVIQYYINALGEDAMAAFTAYFRIEVLLFYSPLMALGHAVMYFCGQNKGAGRIDRARRGTMQGLIITVGLALLCAAIVLPSGGVLFRIFNPDDTVIAIGKQVIRITFPVYFLYSTMQILGDSLRGLGESRGPMLIIAINICVVRTILLMIIAPRYPDVRGVAVTYPITWVISVISMSVYYIHYHRKLRGSERSSSGKQEAER